MTSTISIDKRYGAITAMGGPNPSPLIAIAGPYHRILHAEKNGERVEFLGESEDLGAEVLAVNNETIPNFHVLTAAGAVVVDNADAPQIVTQSEFDPGDGRWLWLFGGTFLATPLARGGVQVLNATTLAQISQMPGVLSDSRFAANFPLRGYLWVADGKQAQIGVFKVSLTTGTLTYVGKVRAPNCRDIIKVVFDDQNGNLFVVCRRRIVRFVAPLTEVDEPLPVFAEDYGIARADYTDFVVLGENQYWIGQNYSTSPTPLDHFHGPLVGVWDSSLGDNGELIVAAPRASIWTVNNAVPYYTEDTIAETVDPPVPPVVVPPVVVPPVILPSPPVITSALTASVTEDTLFSYTTTATGVGPITYGVTSPPSWLTSINPLSGAISGTPPDAGTVNISITATNAGGTTTATLVVTVAAAIANMSQVDVLNGIVYRHVVVGNLLYVVGAFTSLKDANGTYTRNRAACLNMTTGLWTSWNPNANNDIRAITILGSHAYLGGSFTTLGGVAHANVGKVDLATGAQDASFTLNASDTFGGIRDATTDGTFVYFCGNFSTFATSSREGAVQLNTAGSVTSWRLNDGGVRFLGLPGPQRIRAGGGGVFFAGTGRIFNLDGTERMRGFGSANTSSGQVNQLAAGSTSTLTAFASFGSGYLLGASGNTFNHTALPAGSPVVNLTDSVGSIGAGGSLGAVSVDANSGSTDTITAIVVLSDGGFMIGGGFDDIGGNTAYRMVAKLTSSGAIAGGFTLTNSSASNFVFDLGTFGPAAILMGDFDQLLNGVTKKRLAFVNQTTGALY